VLITSPVNQAETTQLYEANLQAGTLALVSEGYNGEPANHEHGRGGVSSVALSADGQALALASGSSNLAFGAINEGSDVFVTEDTEEIGSSAIMGQQSVTALPPGPSGELGWSISTTDRPGPRGTLLIDVSVPGAGRLTASASASVPATVSVHSGPGGASRSRERHADQAAAHVSATKRHTLTTIATRQVAHSAMAAKDAGLLELRLTPDSRYRSLADGQDGLFATITVTFTAPGHPRLRQTLQASFPHVARIHRSTTQGKRRSKSRSARRSIRT
jgi:dipeptidyl aminopeptidase/acylaminoacyl peptidase